MTDNDRAQWGALTADDMQILCRSRASLRYWQKACQSDARAQHVGRMLAYAALNWRVYVRATSK